MFFYTSSALTAYESLRTDSSCINVPVAILGCMQYLIFSERASRRLVFCALVVINFVYFRKCGVT